MQQLIWLETPIAGTNVSPFPSLPWPTVNATPLWLSLQLNAFHGPPAQKQSLNLFTSFALAFFAVQFASSRIAALPSFCFPFDCVLVLPHFWKTSKICKKPKTRRRLRRWLRRQRWLVCNICRLCASDRDLAFICYLAYFHLEGKQSPTRHNPHTHPHTHIPLRLHLVRRLSNKYFLQRALLVPRASAYNIFCNPQRRDAAWICPCRMHSQRVDVP